MRRTSAAARGSLMRPVLINFAWTWLRSRMVLHCVSSGKSVDGCGGEGFEVVLDMVEFMGGEERFQGRERETP